MQADRPVRRLRREIRSGIAELQCHEVLFRLSLIALQETTPACPKGRH
jgi:hypothetical protein